MRALSTTEARVQGSKERPAEIALVITEMQQASEW
jgi:hypothetical protein